MAEHQEIQHPIPIPMEDALVHTDDSPFCADETCPCHESPELLKTLAQQVEGGLLTAEEATNLATGKTI